MTLGAAATSLFVLSILGNVLAEKGIADGPYWLAVRAAVGILFIVTLALAFRPKSSSPEK